MDFWQGPNSGYSHGYTVYERKLSVGADARVGYELPLGFGVYSGVFYDYIRTEARMPDVYAPAGVDVDWLSAAHVHSFHFLTAPVLAEYRLFRNVVRPYVGIGAAFLLGKPHNYLDRTYGSFPRELPSAAHFEYRTVTPALLFGLNLELRRFIVGVAVRRDLAPFWEENGVYKSSYKVRQVAARLGWRIF